MIKVVNFVMCLLLEQENKKMMGKRQRNGKKKKKKKVIHLKNTLGNTALSIHTSIYTSHIHIQTHTHTARRIYSQNDNSGYFKGMILEYILF